MTRAPAVLRRTGRGPTGGGPTGAAPRGRRGARAGAVALVVAVCGGCASAAVSDAPPGAAPQGSDLEGTLVVLAAASLTDVLGDLADSFEAQHPRLRVETAFGSSATLATQVVAGAPVDVLVTASTATMATVTDAVGGEPVVVATNRLQLAVPAGNPAGVTSLDALADDDLTIALCAPQVPCGALTREVLEQAGVTAAPDTLERDVRAVLTRLRLDEADAGLVYRTDVLASAGAVEGIDLPAAVDVATDHPALALPGASDPDAAAAFVALLQSPDGRRAFADAGFGTP